MIEPETPEITAADLARFAAAAAAADDPERVMVAAEAAFCDHLALVVRGDWPAAAGAARTVQDLALQLCAAPAASPKGSDDKRRFLVIIARWVWTRVPTIAAVLEESREQELRRWGNGEGRQV